MNRSRGRAETPRGGQDTLAYYEREARGYAERTRGIDCSLAYASFLARLPPGARVLDAGCGSGRDAAAFKRLGFDVMAMDASPSLAKEAERILDQPVLVCRHQEIGFDRTFDGIWAMATLLHVPIGELPDVLSRYRRALSPQGVLFCSFKVGENDGPDAEGRWFTNMTPTRLRQLADRAGGWRVDLVRETADATRGDTTWLEALLVNAPDQANTRIVD